MSLRKGDIIKSASVNGYDLVIPAYNNPQVLQFHAEASAFAGNTRGKQRVEKFLDYVYGAIAIDDNWNDVGKKVPLQRALYKRKGVCKEKAAALDMLLAMEGIKSEYKRGNIKAEEGRHKGGRHAWLKVEENNQKLLADPTLRLLGDYEYVSRIRGYVEEGALGYIKSICRKIL
jgi:hypothetical protein